ncbi:hypothetical protein T03_5049 [Trichinella britovi]|uniref:Uncharacterized protein n=1 Tax=Trichinella britovi TaxID=45882 RepID=A0A0V1DGW6_TRIBR|nr:hypothetical protein T03_5049 [Trichinella britovi]
MTIFICLFMDPNMYNQQNFDRLANVKTTLSLFTRHIRFSRNCNETSLIKPEKRFQAKLIRYRLNGRV